MKSNQMSRPAFERSRSCLSCPSASRFYPFSALQLGWDQPMLALRAPQALLLHWGNRGCPWVSAYPTSEHPQGAKDVQSQDQPLGSGRMARVGSAIPASSCSCSAFVPLLPSSTLRSQTPNPLPPAHVGAAGLPTQPRSRRWELQADVWGKHTVIHLGSFGKGTGRSSISMSPWTCSTGPL